MHTMANRSLHKDLGNRRDSIGVSLAGVAVTREEPSPGAFGVPAQTPSDAWAAAETVSQYPRFFASPTVSM